MVTTPAGQVHELGALTAAATAATLGWQPVYLGCNMPAEEIVYAVQANGARALALSITYPSDDPRLPDELRRLRRHLPKETAIVVGGRACSGYREVLREIAAVPGTDLETLCSALERLRQGALDEGVLRWQSDLRVILGLVLAQSALD